MLLCTRYLGTFLLCTVTVVLELATPASIKKSCCFWLSGLYAAHIFFPFTMSQTTQWPIKPATFSVPVGYLPGTGTFSHMADRTLILKKRVYLTSNKQHLGIL